MSKLRIAIQKSGRLSQKSLDLLKSCGISIRNGDRKLKSAASNFPIEVLFLRDDDIPQYVEGGIADIGILGENEVLEKGKAVNSITKLDFGKCRLSLAIPRELNYTDPSYFEGKRIATSYPNILKKYLDDVSVNANIEYLSGSVEIAPSIGLADAIFDIVSTGSTLISNGLKEVEIPVQSQAVIIANSNLKDEKTKLLNQLLFRINAVQRAAKSKYILLNSPNDKIDAISAILPGMKSPTVMPLQESGWSSLHSVVYEDEFWTIIDQLKQLGAEGIIVSPIEKLIS